MNNSVLPAIENRSQHTSNACRGADAYSVRSMRKVPTETWEEIFLDACLDEEGYSLNIAYEQEGKTFRASPAVQLEGQTLVTTNTLALSQVSSHWRAITTGYRRLWRSISVDLAILPKGAMPLLQLYLYNSANSSLKLRIRFHRKGSPCDDSRSGRHEQLVRDRRVVLDLLLQRISPASASVCEELVIGPFSSDGLSAIPSPQSPPEFSFSSMRKATIALEGLRPQAIVHFGQISDEGGSLEWLWAPFRDAPLLRDFSGPLGLIPPNTIPYAQLTTLTLMIHGYHGDHGTMGQGFRQVLQQARGLRSLTFRDNTRGSPAPVALTAPPNVLELPSLESFALVLECGELSAPFRYFFEGVAFPELHTFRLTLLPTCCTHTDVSMSLSWHPSHYQLQNLASCVSSAKNISIMFLGFHDLEEFRGSKERETVPTRFGHRFPEGLRWVVDLLQQTPYVQELAIAIRRTSGRTSLHPYPVLDVISALTISRSPHLASSSNNEFVAPDLRRLQIYDGVVEKLPSSFMDAIVKMVESRHRSQSPLCDFSFLYCAPKSEAGLHDRVKGGWCLAIPRRP
ncbi:hypothetical protein V5O48_017510, partial [Marasmius crinis-equi]